MRIFFENLGIVANPTEAINHEAMLIENQGWYIVSISPTIVPSTTDYSYYHVLVIYTVLPR